MTNNLGSVMLVKHKVRVHKDPEFGEIATQLGRLAI
jgi:hypothetical protein